METPDRPELKPYIAGTVRGKKWIPPERPMTKQEEEISVDMGGEYESALNAASEEEIIDLAGNILCKYKYCRAFDAYKQLALFLTRDALKCDRPV